MLIYHCQHGTHAGTLDPMASGLLIVCTGAGTKFVDDYQGMEKEYSGKCRMLSPFKMLMGYVEVYVCTIAK